MQRWNYQSITWDVLLYTVYFWYYRWVVFCFKVRHAQANRAVQFSFSVTPSLSPPNLLFFIL